jgi:putative endonuclease
MKIYYVYILTNKNNTVLYIGITSDIVRRCIEHRTKKFKGFTSRYNVDRLIYYEEFRYVRMAIAREKQLNVITRQKKEILITSFNPTRKELFQNGMLIKPE